MIRVLRLILIWTLLLAPAPLQAALKLKALRVGATTYRNVVVLGANATDVYFRHEDGIANVRLKYLNEDLQRRFNYDAQAATEAERQQLEDDARYQAVLVSNVVARAREVALAAQRAASTSDRNFADSISDRSPLGKAAPKLENPKWAGEPPVLDGKFVIRLFWAPWSIPSRKAVAQLNSFQKQFPDRLVVLGITTESETALEEMPDPKPAFPSVLDPEAKIITSAGVTSIPQVILVNPDGIVLYHGHPAALTVTNLTEAFKPPVDEEEP